MVGGWGGLLRGSPRDSPPGLLLFCGSRSVARKTHGGALSEWNNN